jgi:hypothetical protein
MIPVIPGERTAMGDDEAEGLPQPPADDEAQDETTGGPDTSTDETGAPDSGATGTGDSPAPGTSDGTDTGGVDPKSIYGGG